MPELPEVETVRKGLSEILNEKPQIHSIRLGDKGLRKPFLKKEIKKAHGQKILSVFRRAKYLLFELEKNVLVSHLGMTGSWRLKEEKRNHDHVELKLTDGRTLVYRDPRRFGQFELLDKQLWQENIKFSSLGPEPLDKKSFHADYLHEKICNSKATIKSLIMDQKIVVGVGNIYASEALFLAGIPPMTKGQKVKHNTCSLLVESIREILQQAIECGGSTISDFRQAGGSEGYFQNFFYVYDRDGESCIYCSTSIKSQVIAGRSSFWCPGCQSGSIIKKSSSRSQRAQSVRKKTSRTGRT